MLRLEVLIKIAVLAFEGIENLLQYNYITKCNYNLITTPKRNYNPITTIQSAITIQLQQPKTELQFNYNIPSTITIQLQQP